MLLAEATGKEHLMRFKNLIVIGVGIAIGSLARTATAQPVIDYKGIAVTAGGGVMGFTDKGMRDNTTVAGAWDVLAQFSTKSWLSIEGQYLGTASSIDSLVGGKSANLVGHAIGGDVRFNALPDDAWQPYGFVGAAYRRYDVTGASFSTSDAGMNDSDNLLEIPVGAGLAYREGNLVVDVRGTFRAAVDSALVLKSATATDYVPMHNWAATARIGWEF